MKSRAEKTIFLIVPVLILCIQPIWAQKNKPAISEIDRIRLDEAFRLAGALGEQIWKGWNKVPFSVLLVTPENDFLIRHPNPSKDFALIGYDSLLESNVYFRKRTERADFLATFPAVGNLPTIVVGEAENTFAKTSTPWVVTLLHEHFHQMQYSQPNYYAEVDALDLARGDQTGMWMINFAFPYKDEQIKTEFPALSKLLVDAILTENNSEFAKKLKIYLEARHKFQQMLTPEDYKYFSFQIWQEGIARYTELRIAELAARKYKPSKQFLALKDYTPFAAVADSILKKQIIEFLPSIELDKRERIVFYPFGAAEGILLDKAKSPWNTRYFAEKFDVEKYFSTKK